MRTKLLQDWYISKEYLAKNKARGDIWNKCGTDQFFITKMALEVWSKDPIAFIETFGWVIIPEFNNAIKPFFLFPYQRKIIEKIHQAELSGEDHEILVDKPRGMGLTWTLVGIRYGVGCSSRTGEVLTCLVVKVKWMMALWMLVVLMEMPRF